MDLLLAVKTVAMSRRLDQVLVNSRKPQSRLRLNRMLKAQLKLLLNCPLTWDCPGPFILSRCDRSFQPRVQVAPIGSPHRGTFLLNLLAPTSSALPENRPLRFTWAYDFFSDSPLKHLKQGWAGTLRPGELLYMPGAT